MNTQEFLTLLSGHSDQQLRFEYAPGKFVKKAFHITEVKNINFQSVDCGGNSHTGRQTVVQLWVPTLERKQKYMQAGKAFSILQKVSGVTSLDASAPLYIEYGDAQLPTAQYEVKSTQVDGEYLDIRLFAPPTACKPKLKVVETVKKCCNTAACCQ